MTRTHHLRHNFKRRAWIISWAALAPEAPVRPLPGGVPEPHRKRLRMGVL